MKQNKSTEGCLKFKVWRHENFRRNWSKHTQVPNGTESGIQGSSSNLLTNRTRCKYSIETSLNLAIRSTVWKGVYMVYIIKRSF